MEETKHNSVCTDKWMIKLLEQNGWWLRSEHALFVCKELGITQPAVRFYYRSIYIWLPDIRYGIDSMPSCPNGCCSSNVSSHGFCSGDISNIARRVTGITTHYYVISKRYKCKSCEKTKGTDTPLYFFISLISTFLAQGVSVEISAQPQLFWSRRSSKESFSPLSLFLPPSFLPPSPFLPLFPPSSLSSANLICRHRNRKKAGKLGEMRGNDSSVEFYSLKYASRERDLAVEAELRHDSTHRKVSHELLSRAP
jgi:hypothetical protein